MSEDQHDAAEAQPDATDAQPDAPETQPDATWSVADWHGKMLIDSDGEKIGKLEGRVRLNVENDEPQFATVKEGLHPPPPDLCAAWSGSRLGPDELRVAVTKEQVEVGA